MSQIDVTSEEDDEKETANTDDSYSQSTAITSKLSVSTPVSILMESLIKNICSMYEEDEDKASLMYKIICDKLYSVNLLGESYSMTEFEGMRSQYQRAFFHLLHSVTNGAKSITLKPMSFKNGANSHYKREFDEIEFIAGGGFGQVYRVKHKLDGTDYAIKKIQIRTEGIQSVRNYLSEVKTFASMNHPNIVQYKGAWIEIGAPTIKAITDKHVEVNSVSHSRVKYIYRQDRTQSLTEEIEDSSSDFQIHFEHSVSGAGHNKSQVSRKWKRKHSLSEGEGNMTICKLDLKKIEKIQTTNKTKVKWATLYIQMALCHSTLKQWLEKRNDVTDPDTTLVHRVDPVLRTNTIKQILMQLLSGLEYIHSKNVVHHDIKPSNIFIDIENDGILVQLGDFGLACPLQSNRHTLAFGTKLYAAPEQLAGKCNPKSDMYSLGIVLYELVENFGTDMERVQLITHLRKGHVPSHLFDSHPELAHIISNLVDKNPDNRPDTSTLLHNLKSNETTELIDRLKVQLAEKDEEILHLKELLRSHGIQSV